MLRYSKFIILLLIVGSFGFAWLIVDVYRETQSEPIAIISAWFAFAAAELQMLASIKKREKTGKNEVVQCEHTERIITHGSEASI